MFLLQKINIIKIKHIEIGLLNFNKKRQIIKIENFRSHKVIKTKKFNLLILKVFKLT